MPPSLLSADRGDLDAAREESEALRAAAEAAASVPRDLAAIHETAVEQRRADHAVIRLSSHDPSHVTPDDARIVRGGSFHC